jgi:hypothetical protein
LEDFDIVLDDNIKMHIGYEGENWNELRQYTVGFHVCNNESMYAGKLLES